MITLVAASGEKNELGKLGLGNNALWNLPDDYNRFKNLTHGYPVIMGRKSFGTMDDIMDDRLNIVLTKNADFKAQGIVVAHTLEEAIERAFQENEQIFIIGGGQVFKMSLPYADRIELTRIHASFADADTFFPEFTKKDWKLVKSIHHPADERHQYSFDFQTWERVR